MSPSDDEITYEQARAELASVVTALESGGVPLAESVALWRRGERLADICQQWLDGAKAALDEASQMDQAAQTK